MGGRRFRWWASRSRGLPSSPRRTERSACGRPGWSLTGGPGKVSGGASGVDRVCWRRSVRKSIPWRTRAERDGGSVVTRGPGAALRPGEKEAACRVSRLGPTERKPQVVMGFSAPRADRLARPAGGCIGSCQRDSRPAAHRSGARRAARQSGLSGLPHSFSGAAQGRPDRLAELTPIPEMADEARNVAQPPFDVSHGRRLVDAEVVGDGVHVQEPKD